MPIAHALIAILILTAYTLIYLHRNARGTPTSASHETAIKAIEKIKDWSTWMAGLSTGAIGMVGYIAKNKPTFSNWQQIFAFYSLLFFGASILLSTYVLSCLPTLYYRINPEESLENDIYHKPIFVFSRLRLGPLTGLKHAYFITGVLFISLLIYSTYISS